VESRFGRAEARVNASILSEYMQARETTTLSWARRHSRKIQRMAPGDLALALSEVELSGKITTKKYGRRTYLIWVGKK